MGREVFTDGDEWEERCSLVEMSGEERCFTGGDEWEERCSLMEMSGKRGVH